MSLLFPHIDLRRLPSHKKLTNLSENSARDDDPAPSEPYRDFSAVLGAQLRQSLNIIPRHQHVFDLHVEILEAVERQDPEQAKALCRQLINEP